MGREEHAPDAVHHEDDIAPYTPPVPQAHRDEDQETAAYVGQEVTYVDEKTSEKLFWTVNRRILACMLRTYFCQSLGFASIMGIKKDAHLVG